MNTDQRRNVGTQLAFVKNDELFIARQRAITRDAEVAPFGRQFGFGHSLYRQSSWGIWTNKLFNWNLFDSATHR